MKQSETRDHTVELLAPAGSIESFHAAIYAGADAIYLGLSDYNARVRAKNFTVKTLSCLVPYAHSRKVKVYVALNTLVKQDELAPVIHVIYQLGQIGIDALIVADIGLASIIHTHFPKIVLHASTQMTVHNSIGMLSASHLGFRRVVLARELTANEIRSIARSTRLELEVFVHGALCYSISGLCLASSYLGGSSGNRGKCTQVCRRKFTQGDTTGAQGYFFAPDDLCALDYLPLYKECRISSLKIEGRMKGPEYVSAVVSAYRLAIDNPAMVERAREILTDDMGRPKTAFFLNGTQAPGIIRPLSPSGTGIAVGTIEQCVTGSLVIETNLELTPGDRIRIHPRDGFEGTALTITHVTRLPDRQTIAFKGEEICCSKGDLVYLISRKSAIQNVSGKHAEQLSAAHFDQRCPFVETVFKTLRRPKQEHVAAYHDRLWLRIGELAWLPYAAEQAFYRLILDISVNELEKILSDETLLATWRSRIAIALPPFIAENDLALWKNLIAQFADNGIHRWLCSNIGHRALFGKTAKLIADSPLWCLNTATQSSLRKIGFSHFTYSPEDDYLNVKSAASPDGLITLFSHAPLFISRIEPPAKKETSLTDPHANAFLVRKRGDLFYLIPQKPFCITQQKKRLQSLGIQDFVLDLTVVPPNREFLNALVNHYRAATRLPETSLFNFKAVLK